MVISRVIWTSRSAGDSNPKLKSQLSGSLIGAKAAKISSKKDAARCALRRAATPALLTVIERSDIVLFIYLFIIFLFHSMLAINRW